MDNPSRSWSRTRSRSREPSRFSPTTLIVPIAIVARLAMMLPSTTNFTVVQLISCRLWYTFNNPGGIPASGPIPDELCKIPEIDKYYTALSSILATFDGVGTVLSSGAFGYISSRVGRKPVLVFALTIAMFGQLSVMTSQHVGHWLQLTLFGTWVLCSTLSQPPAMMYVINMYIVDVSEPEERTAALSKIAGWTTFGAALALTLGGSITRETHGTVAVYLTASTVLLLACAYVIYLVPESFTKSKREKLRRERQHLNPVDAKRSFNEKIRDCLSVVFEPLQYLKPSIHPETGRRNLRLIYCAIHIFIVTVADGYAVLSMILYFTTQYDYDAAQTGYVLTTLNMAGMIVLTGVIPLIVRFLRPLYQRQGERTIRLSSEEVPLVNDDSSTASSSSEGDAVSETSDHLDVHITIGSWVVESIAYISVGTTKTLFSQLASVACIGFGAGRAPVFRSLVAATVDPLKQGEAMACIEMVASMGLILSPIVMGSITTETINTAPQTIFYVHAFISLLGASVLFLIKDSDRFQKPHIALEEEEDNQTHAYGEDNINQHSTAATTALNTPAADAS